MPVIVKRPSGNWRAQVRRKGRYIGSTFRRQQGADAWALETECNIDCGFDSKLISSKAVRTFADINDLHVGDLLEVGKQIRRSKSAVLEALRLSLGPVRLDDLRRTKLIEFGKRRAERGARAATQRSPRKPCCATTTMPMATR